MRRFFRILGRIVLTLVGVLALCIGYAAYRGRGLDESCKAYAEANLPPILSTWSMDEILKRSTKGLYQQIKSDEQLAQKVFRRFGVFGKFTSLGELKCDSRVFLNPLQGTSTTAACVGTAHFEKGDAALNLLLAMENDEWRVHALNLNSPLLLD